MRYKLGARVNFYSDPVATGKHSFTGERFDPLPKVDDVKHYNGDVQAAVGGDEEPDRPLRLINWKPRTQGMHRTQNSPWLRETQPENPLWINPDDAEARGIESGDKITIDAGRRTVEGIARVTGGIRPGVVGAAWGGVGAAMARPTRPSTAGRKRLPRPMATPYKFDQPMHDDAGIAKGRDAGFAVNHIQPLDSELGDTGLSDLVGGSNAQYDAFVEVERK